MAMVTPGDIHDAELIGSWFSVVIDSKKISGSFKEVSGLSIEVQAITIEQSDKDTTTRNRPGTTKYGELTLKRSLTSDRSFWDWIKSIRDGATDYRANGSVDLFDIAGTKIGGWEFVNAWPSKWSASDLDVGTDDPMQETVVLQIEQLKRTK